MPRSLLRRFSIDGARQQVWVFDKRTGRSFSAGLGGAGSANDYNTLTKSDGETLNFEPAFDAIDAIYAAVGDDLHHGRSVADIPPDIKALLAEVTAVQFLRTPIMRSTFMSIPRELDQMIVDIGYAPTSESEFPTDNDARLLSVKAIAERRNLVEALIAKDLILLEPAGAARFWTSDHPIVRRSDAPDCRVGFTSQGVQIYLPISSNLMLGFLCPSVLKSLTHLQLETMRVEPNKLARPIAWRDALLNGTPVKIEDALVDDFNRAQAHQSRRFLYAERDDFGSLDDAVTERDSVVMVGKMGQGPGRSPNVPEGQFLALYGRERTHLLPLIQCNRSVDRAEAVTDLPALLDDILSDQPFSRAEFYIDRHALRMIGGGVDIVVLERGKTVRFRVIHSDPSLQALDDMLQRRS